MRSILFILLIPLLLFQNGCEKEVRLSKNQKDVIYIRNNGADMPAYVYGNAASKTFTILLHGGPGDNGLSYRLGRWFEIMEEEVAMVYWDQRGQGMSHGHYSQSDLTIDQMAEDLFVLVRTLKLRYGDDISLFIMGHSWGGTLGTAYLIDQDYEDEVRGWIEVDGAHDLPLLNKEAAKMYIRIGEEEIAAGNHKGFWREVVDYSKSLDTNNISLDESAELNEYSYRAEELIDDVHYEDFSGAGLFLSPLNSLTSAASGINVNTLMEEESETANYTDLLGNITVPSLFIWGKYDFNVPPAVGISGYDHVGAAEKELHILERSGHSPMDNESDLFCELVLDFIKRHE